MAAVDFWRRICKGDFVFPEPLQHLANGVRFFKWMRVLVHQPDSALFVNKPVAAEQTVG
ncbi:MAG: hypothetical protein V1494_05115 [Candidatus Diapherotrites archaeon]